MISSTDKPALRTRMLELRRRAAQARPEAGQLLAAGFPDQWIPPAGAVVAGYWPLTGEIDPRPLMNRLAAKGVRLCLPVVMGAGRALSFRSYRDGDPLERRGMGVSEPLASQAECRPNLLLVPLLASDHAGNRLGFGKGYYDCTLATLRASGPTLAIGLAFDCQMVAELPAYSHDEPLDGLVSDTTVFDFRDEPTRSGGQFVPR
ncbi:5-formyltetrahydrofolate cyclo-ligase [Maricaulis sp.]|uniref:5-formyltetrahydrofolate cyclo-ligase n=1 Tax=Maricaulis sp. TaxID=1486257 RepID=UPI0025C0425F|nr:5-formyltetrahydrofolate cyclo-ligase [Maricaulis sp.]